MAEDLVLTILKEVRRDVAEFREFREESRTQHRLLFDLLTGVDRNIDRIMAMLPRPSELSVDRLELQNASKRLDAIEARLEALERAQP